jgi:transposase
MTDKRRQHLELVAASLTQAYYSEHTAASRDYRELLDTFSYILEALVEKDSLPPGHSPLSASDSLANPLTADSRD